MIFLSIHELSILVDSEENGVNNILDAYHEVHPTSVLDLDCIIKDVTNAVKVTFVKTLVEDNTVISHGFLLEFDNSNTMLQAVIEHGLCPIDPSKVGKIYTMPSWGSFYDPLSSEQ